MLVVPVARCARDGTVSPARKLPTAQLRSWRERAFTHQQHHPVRLVPFLTIALVLCLPAPAWSHGDPLADMPLTAQALRAPAPSLEAIVLAARTDVARPVRGERAACLRLLQWTRTLDHRNSPPVLRENAAAIRARVVALQRDNATGFWQHVCLAALDEDAPDLVLQATGFLGHALQAGEHLDAARSTFLALRNDPEEGPHALAHLGRIAVRTQDIATAVDIWLSHPAGPVAAVSMIAREADALWRENPERSYQAIAFALERIDRTFPKPSPELTAARMRLLVRTRENAMPARR